MTRNEVEEILECYPKYDLRVEVGKCFVLISRDEFEYSLGWHSGTDELKANVWVDHDVHTITIVQE